MKNKFGKIWVVTAVLIYVLEMGLGMAEKSSVAANARAAAMPWHLQLTASAYILIAVVAIVGGFAFTHIFLRGYQGRGWSEGLRYGIWVTLLASVTENLSYAAVLPLGRRLPAEFIVADLITFVICGIAAAAIAGTTQISGAASAG